MARRARLRRESNLESATTAPERASPNRQKRIRGRRWLLFSVDLEREIARPLCMGKSADWLALRGAKLSRPAVARLAG